MNKSSYIDLGENMNDWPENLSKVFKALGHPTRLRVIDLLASGPWCVCEMVPELNVEQSNLSKHLSVLRREGLVSGEKVGLRIVYRLEHDALVDILAGGRRLLAELDSGGLSALIAGRDKAERGEREEGGSVS